MISRRAFPCFSGCACSHHFAPRPASAFLFFSLVSTCCNCWIISRWSTALTSRGVSGLARRQDIITDATAAQTGGLDRNIKLQQTQKTLVNQAWSRTAVHRGPSRQVKSTMLQIEPSSQLRKPMASSLKYQFNSLDSIQNFQQNDLSEPIDWIHRLASRTH